MFQQNPLGIADAEDREIDSKTCSRGWMHGGKLLCFNKGDRQSITELFIQMWVHGLTMQ